MQTIVFVKLIFETEKTKLINLLSLLFNYILNIFFSFLFVILIILINYIYMNIIYFIYY